MIVPPESRQILGFETSRRAPRDPSSISGAEVVEVEPPPQAINRSIASRNLGSSFSTTFQTISSSISK
jgi:hypothetical protein